MNEPTLNDRSANPAMDDNDTFSALAQAMSKGDTAEIDRLMAVEDAKANEDEDVSHDEVDPLLDPKDSSPDTEDADNEAAKAAQAEQDQNAGSTPAEIEAMKAELHRLRSDVGRVGHLQRTVQELQRQARASEEARQRQAQVADPTPPAKSKTKELPEDLQKRITALKEVDPELADTFEVFAKTMSQETDARANEVQRTFEEHNREQEDARHWQEQKAELYKMVPRCDEIFAMPEWQEWKESLTPGQRGLTESGFAQDMATAIYGFASHMQARQQAYDQANQAAPRGGDPVTNTGAATHSQVESNTEVNDARARKVGAAADVRSTAAKKVEALDEQKLYEQYYKDIAQANHILPK
jgi:hypothetical protein